MVSWTWSDTTSWGTRQYVPGLPDIEYIDAVGARLPEVWLHVHLQVLGT